MYIRQTILCICLVVEDYMADEKTSILLADVSIEGDLVEKDKIILDAKIIIFFIFLSFL